MDIKDKAFVVTGGVSLIGSHIAELLLEQGARKVVLFDNYSLGTTDMIAHLIEDERVEVFRGDLLRINELFDAFNGCDGVFAAAGFLTLPMSQNPPLGLAVNVQGHVNLLEACRYTGVKKVIFSSSIAAYGDPEVDTIVEDEAFHWQKFQPAAALYGSTKIIGENLGRLYEDKYGVQSISLRYSTVYGERQHYRAVNALYIVKSYDQIKNGERPTISGDGSEVHDYIHVSDVAAANVGAMRSDVSGESFNVVTGVAPTLNEIVDIIIDVVGSDLKPEYKTDGSGVKSTSSSHLNLSYAKAEKMLGWKPAVSIKEGITRLIRWRESTES